MGLTDFLLHSRLLYSNDGLLFVTYDHYMSFYEIGLENFV